MRGFVISIVCAALAATALSAALTSWHAHDALIYAALLGLGVVTVEANRKLGEAAGASKDAHGLWELPIAILLPPCYALLAPAVVLAVTQRRVRHTLVHRRVFSAAALGLAGGAASVLFHAAWGVARPLPGSTAGLLGWGLLAAACGIVRWAVSSALVYTVVRRNDPMIALRSVLSGLREVLGGWGSLGNDTVELCAGVLTAFCVAAGPVLLLFAVPCGIALQRSARRTQLAHPGWTDAETGLLSPAAWRREAAVRVSQAARTGAPQAVAIVHIDHYAGIVGSCGPMAASRVVRDVADALAGGTAARDLRGRFGPAEFVILLQECTAPVALSMAELLRARVGGIPMPTTPCGGLVAPSAQVTVSVGVAALTGPGRDLTDLLAAADAALYRARRGGDSSVRLASVPPSADTAAPLRRSLRARRLPRNGSAQYGPTRRARGRLSAGHPGGGGRPSCASRLRLAALGRDRSGHTPRPRPMISFMISVVPPKMVCARPSANARATGYSRM
ncbi:MAG TPA: GGDEF domain-containing protein [Streptosporangiaceae bacterium]